MLYIDAIHYSVRDNGIIRKLAAYVIPGINQEGRKEVLTIEVGKNESSKYWLSVLNGLKNQGVKDIYVICAGGLSGIKEANVPSDLYGSIFKSFSTSFNWDWVLRIFELTPY